MNNEDFVTYEQALALKKLMFKDKCYQYYNTSGIIQDNDFICNEVFQIVISSQLHSSHNSSVPKETCDAPTLAQVQKWLREEKNLSIEPYFIRRDYVDDKQWFCSIINLSNKVNGSDDLDLEDTFFTTYEEALSAGITYCLENL